MWQAIHVACSVQPVPDCHALRTKSLYQCNDLPLYAIPCFPLPAVRLLPRTHWVQQSGPAADANISPSETAEHVTAAEAEEDVLLPDEDISSGPDDSALPTGEVVGILQRSQQNIVGTMSEQDEQALQIKGPSSRSVSHPRLHPC